MNTIPLFIVDDQNLFRQSLAMLLGTIKEVQLVGEYDSGDTLLSALSTMTLPKPCIALIDLEMSGMNGIELNDVLHTKYPSISVIILSVHVNPSLISQMIDAKAAAYLAKNCDKKELLTAITSVANSGFYFNPEVLKAIKHSAYQKAQTQTVIQSLPSKLSKREVEVLRYICQEFSTAEIATKLYLSPRTVETYRNNLLIKTGCRNTAGLVLFAIKYNLYSVPL